MKKSYGILLIILSILVSTGIYYAYKYDTVYGTSKPAIQNDVSPETLDRAEVRAAEVLQDQDNEYANRRDVQYEAKWPNQLGRVTSSFGFSLLYPMNDFDVFHIEGDDEDEPLYAYIFVAKNYVLDMGIEMNSYEKDVLSILVDEELIQFPVIVGVYDPNRYITDITKYAEGLINAELADSRSNQNIIIDHNAWRDFALANRQWKRLDYKKQIMVGDASYPVTCSEYFIHENDMIMRITINILDENNLGDNLSILAKKTRDDAFSIADSFMFDRSTKNFFGKNELSNAEYFDDPSYKKRKKEMLEKLRNEPYSDSMREYDYEVFGKERCDDRTEESKNTESREYGLLASPTGAYFSVTSGCFDDDIKKCATIHGYDMERRHSGPINPEGTDMEEAAMGYNVLDMLFQNYVIAVREFDPGTIEINGTGYGMATLSIHGDGNSCIFAQVSFYVTPYTIAKVPIKSTGEVGPIIYDIDGDKKIDAEICLKHPLTKEKEELIIRIVNEMYVVENCRSGKMSSEECEKYFLEHKN